MENSMVFAWGVLLFAMDTYSVNADLITGTPVLPPPSSPAKVCPARAKKLSYHETFLSRNSSPLNFPSWRYFNPMNPHSWNILITTISMTEPSYHRFTYHETFPSQDCFHGTLLSHEFPIMEPFDHRFSYHAAFLWRDILKQCIVTVVLITF